jgi:DNA polymerase III alpha subunit
MSELDSCPRSGWVVMGGVVDKLTKKITKKGSVMMFATLQDLSGAAEFLVFPKTYEQTKDLWVEGQVMVIMGKTPEEDGDHKVFVEKVWVLTPESVSGIKDQLRMVAPRRESSDMQVKVTVEQRVSLVISADELKKNTPVLKKIFSEHPGHHKVYFSIGTKLVETKTEIEPDLVCQKKISTLFGADRLKIEN